VPKIHYHLMAVGQCEMSCWALSRF